MKFAHLADCHLGAWREPELTELSVKTFEEAVNICIQEEVDFILIAGDLLNTSMPAVDILKKLTSLLKKLQEENISVYAVEGSHDYSPTGKTMLKVLEKAGLLQLVAKGKMLENKLKLKFTQDKKTQAKITGVKGLKGSLEENTYQNLLRENLEKEEGFKIFLFHSGLVEYKPEDLKEMEAIPTSLLPKNFNYYAGGHVHEQIYEEYDEGVIAFPGALFPTDIKELEEQGWGGFYIINVERGELKPQRHEIKKVDLEIIEASGEKKTPQEVEKEILDKVKQRELEGKVVLLKVEGTLSSGRPWEVNMREISQAINEEEPLILKVNNKLESKEFQEVKVDPHKSKEKIEKELITEYLGKVKIDLAQGEEENLTKELMNSLNQEKMEDEVKRDYQKRILGAALKTLNLKQLWENEN